MNPTVKDNWYEDFFQGINCELWEKAVPDAWTDQEVELILDELQLTPGQSILDIPCGFGRHAIKLAVKGFAVTGVDISETYIHSLNQKIKAGRLPIKTILSDILLLQPDQQFDGAICMGNSFGYFNIDLMRIFVEKVASFLKPGAKFVVNSGMIAESIIPNFSKNKSFQIGNINMEITNHYRATEGYMESHIRYTKDGVSEDHSFKHFVFTLSEVIRLLLSFGLTTIGVYSGPDKTTFTLGDPQMYLVAIKQP